MKYNPKIHKRRSIRLKGYDYSQEGLYFITICCQNREHFFGKITNNEMVLNDAGKMIKQQWLAISERFKNIALEEFIIMPNHFHAILNIVGATLVVDQIKEKGFGKGQPQGFAPTDFPTDKTNPIKGQPQGFAPTDSPTDKTVGDIIGAFKSITTNEYIKNVKSNNWKRFEGKLWQRNYWEHIIRNNKAYINISEYIVNNPKKWNNDTLHKK